MITRRTVLGAAGAALAGSGWRLTGTSPVQAAALELPPALPEGTRAAAALDALPGKKPLIKLSYRPPNYETPLEYLRTEITPNDAFFVRYHLSDIPQVDAKTWKLVVGGEGAERRAELTLGDLKAMPAFEVTAVIIVAGQAINHAFRRRDLTGLDRTRADRTIDDSFKETTNEKMKSAVL